MNLGSSLFELEIQRNQNKNGVFILIRGFLRQKASLSAHASQTDKSARRADGFAKWENGGREHD